MKLLSRLTPPLATALALAGCATVPPPVTQSPTNPANAAATEGPVQKLEIFAPPFGSSPLAVGAPPAMAMPGMDHSKMDAPKQDASADTYTCVMHPQISEPKPGKCPICEMALVKKPKEKK